MIPILSGNVATAIGGGYEVANSCRFNSGDSPKMVKTLGTPTSTKIGTISCWIKRGSIGVEQHFLGTAQDGNDRCSIGFDDSAEGELHIVQEDSGSYSYRFKTTARYRDPSAWMHLVLAMDTTQASASNRVKIYINGTQVTDFATETQPSQDTVIRYGISGEEFVVGAKLGGGGSYGNFYHGYLAEVVFIDGQQLTPTSFGEFDDDSPTIWKPKDVSGLTMSGNSFYLDFEDSSNLGNDIAGNGDFTESNLAATDQCVDSPTNNFAVLNPLDNYYASHTFSEGNCKIVTHSGNMSFNTATIPVSSGKWYVEAKVIDNADSNYHHVGITETPSSASSNWIGLSATHYGLTGYDGKYWRNNSGTSYGISNTTNDIVGMYIDLDNNKLYFAKNGTVMNSGTGISITAAASTTNGYYFISYGDWENASTATWEVNFGSPTYSVTSSNSDPNNYGSFEYSTTITGDGSSKSFYALCTKNLAEFGG
jgi:hypothetical protein